MITMDFLKEMLPYLFGILSTPLGAWLGSRLEKRKYNIVLDELNAKIENQQSSNRKSELENVREANGILMDTIVRPLEEKLNDLQNELERLHQAIAKIHTCTYAPSCPVVKCLHYYSQGGEPPRAIKRGKKSAIKQERAGAATA